MRECRSTPKPRAMITEPSPLITGRDAALMRRVLSMRAGTALPPHQYTLASSDDLYSGPDWLPFNLWQLCEFETFGPIVQRCAQKLARHADAKALWHAIAARYARPDFVAGNLPVVCANAMADWQVQPRLTPSQYKASRARLANHARQLATELERFYLARDEDERENPGLLYFTQLQTDDEGMRFDDAQRYIGFAITNRARRDEGLRAIDWDEYHDDQAGTVHSAAERDVRLIRALTFPLDGGEPIIGYCGVPTLPDMLRRIADKFVADGETAPVARPKAPNTQRNRFAYAVVKYFWTSFGDVSPALVARITSVFFAQGITENEISQLARKVKTAHPLPNEGGSVVKFPPQNNG